MQSVVAAAAAVTIITINKELLFLPHNCLLKCFPGRSCINCFPREGDFSDHPCAVAVGVRHGAPAPPAGRLRGNGSTSILLAGAALTSAAPARGREHRQPAAADKSVASPIDEDLFSPGF